MAIVAVIVVIVSVVLMFSVSAILGSILYVAAFLYSLYVLRPKILVDGQISVEGFTQCAQVERLPERNPVCPRDRFCDHRDPHRPVLLDLAGFQA